jgi:chromate transporter
MTTSSAFQEGHTIGQPPTVPFMEALRFWVKLGFISFGGPAGQIAIMHQELVETKQWISERQFLRALNFCMLLPGPEAQQLATYMGWRLHGIGGGLVAGSLFVLPAVFVLLALSWLSAAYADVTAVSGLFYGIQAVVLAIVLEAVLRIGRRALTHPALVAFAVGALLALQVPGISFPLVIAAAALGGLALYHWLPHIFHLAHADEDDAPDEEARARLPTLRRNLKLLGVFVVLWVVPVGLLWAWRGSDDVLFQEAIFFTETAFITFGGAYAVLSYITEMAVNHYQWLTTAEMLRGLGLAESTPGPLIMVTQYVGFMGAWNMHSEFPPALYGTFGALVTTYVTFLPCFLFIFLGAPYIEFLARQKRLQAALTGVTAAVVGVIANLALFFGGSVLLPEGAGFDWFALLLAVLAFYLLRWQKFQIYWVVPLGAVAGMLWTLIGPGAA